MTDARLILLCGLPGSGKTTLAKQLAPLVPAVRLSPDEWKHDLGIDYYDEPARVRLEDRLWRLAQELLSLGVSVILENGFWSREERDGLRAAARARSVPVELHFVDAPVDELWRRLEVRNAAGAPGTAPIGRDDLLRWAQQFEAPDDVELAQYDDPPPGRSAAGVHGTALPQQRRDVDDPQSEAMEPGEEDREGLHRP